MVKDKNIIKDKAERKLFIKDLKEKDEALFIEMVKARKTLINITDEETATITTILNNKNKLKKWLGTN